MAHAPTVGPLVLSNETRRGGAFLPLSLAAHVAAVGALLLVPHAARPELPSVAALARDVIVLPVTRTDPPPVTAISQWLGSDAATAGIAIAINSTGAMGRMAARYRHPRGDGDSLRVSAGPMSGPVR